MMYALSLFFITFLSYASAWPFSVQNDNFLNYSTKLKVNLTGFMVAFGDFNSDRATDVFVLDVVNGMQQIDVILMTKDTQKAANRIPLLKYNDSGIVGVVAGDFNGDSILDLMIYRGKPGLYSLEIAYGNADRTGVSSPMKVAEGLSFVTQPLHLDWNADMIGDMFGQLPDKTFVVLLGQTNKSFAISKLPNIDSYLDIYLYSKFMDMDNDGQADILLIGRKNNYFAMTSFVKKNGQFVFNRTYVSGTSAELMGQGVVNDFTFTGELSMIMPMCKDKTCSNSYLLFCSLRGFTCIEAPMSISVDLNPMQFIPGKSVTKLSLAMPEIVPISCGDLHLSGHIECLMIMTKLGVPTVVLLKHNENMNFSIKSLEGSADLFTNISQVAVFDLEEDGIPDILTARQQGSSGLISPLLHESSNDQYFIKVMVLNGLCSNPDNCPGNKLPYGIPLPGISVSYSTESASGGTQLATTSLCPDSDFSSLPLPYAHFGLGSFANYVEKLYVKLPYNTTSRQHTLSFIVPKTQIVIIPYTLDNPSIWTNKLFLEPFHDKKVIFVAAALLGSFLIVSIIACILQYLEVRVDRLEKMQEAQKFHFDAM